MGSKSEIRLEILKLVHAHGREIPEVISRAKALEAYVTDESIDAPAPKSEPKKITVKGNGKAGNLESIF